MLWLLASESLDGEICADVDKISFRLRMLSDEFIEALKPLIKQGFIVDASAALSPRYSSAMPEAEAEAEERQSIAAPSAPLLVEHVNGVKPKRSSRSKQFEIPALRATQQEEEAFDRVWAAWPEKGWNSDTKTANPRRIEHGKALGHFVEILKFIPHTLDKKPLTADELANAAIDYAKAKVKEANGAIPYIPCIANFFSSDPKSKKHWQSALMAHFEE